MRILPLILVSTFCSCVPIIAQISKPEKRIIKSVDSNNAEALKFLKEVTNINSGSMNFEGVKKVGTIFREKFDALGFETKWVEGVSFQRSGHLIATHQGSSNGPKLLLIGHLDTVFEPDSPFQEYKMVNDSIMKGPGVVDMKGGDVIIIYALKALKESRLLDKMNIEVVMTGDEEKSGSPLELARKDLIAAADRADIAIGFENGDSNPRTAVVSRRGAAGWELFVTGTPAHSSQIFSERIGSGAIYEASRILTAFHEELSSEQYLTFNPGVMLGGTSVDYDPAKDGGSSYGKSNIVAKQAIVKGDIRAVSPEQLERAKKVMREIVQKNYPQTSATIKFSNNTYPPLAPSEGNNELLSIYDKASQDLGFGPVTAVHPINAGAADVSFTSGRVDKAIDGLGLSGGKDHTIEEYGNIEMLPVLTKRAAVFLYRLTSSK
ncbi:MAG: M20/M25/M40 family metallo-hydrolase [Bacteroidota bacterium]